MVQCISQRKLTETLTSHSLPSINSLWQSLIINIRIAVLSLSLFQECGRMFVYGWVAPHCVSALSGHQCVNGNVCHACEGDRHNCVWSVHNLRCAGALPQASSPVSTKFCLFIFSVFIGKMAVCVLGDYTWVKQHKFSGEKVWKSTSVSYHQNNYWCCTFQPSCAAQNASY